MLRLSKETWLLLSYFHKRLICGAKKFEVADKNFLCRKVKETKMQSDINDLNHGRADSSNQYLLQQSRMIRENIHSISQMLNTGLSAESLDICIKLIEAGIHPQALAEIITQIQREASMVKQQTNKNHEISTPPK